MSLGLQIRSLPGHLQSRWNSTSKAPLEGGLENKEGRPFNLNILLQWATKLIPSMIPLWSKIFFHSFLAIGGFSEHFALQSLNLTTTKKPSKLFVLVPAQLNISKGWVILEWNVPNLLVIDRNFGFGFGFGRNWTFGELSVSAETVLSVHRKWTEISKEGLSKNFIFWQNLWKNHKCSQPIFAWKCSKDFVFAQECSSFEFWLLSS